MKGSSLLVLLLLLVETAAAACFSTLKNTARTKDCFLYDGNNISVVFIGAHVCERVWEFIIQDDHLKIIIVENYV